MHVVGLIPNLPPSEYRKQLEYPEKLPGLSDSENMAALMAMESYLTDVRT